MMQSLASALIVAAMFCAAPWAAAQPANLGVVLLDNGQVLHGTVVNEGNQALITLGPGSQMRLSQSQVLCAGRTLDDLFEFQHRRLDSHDVAERINLARWCLRMDLTAAAGQVVVELVRLAPDDPRVSALEQQLRRNVSKPVAATPETPVKLPPADELADVAQQLSPAAFDMYMRQIQPLLVNHCSASGCHGATSKTDFQLLGPLTGPKLSQRMTQRNLHAVLTRIDRQEPLKSSLLVAAITTHATLEKPLFHEQSDREEIALLKEWLLAVGSTHRRPAKQTVTPSSSTPVLMQPQLTPRESGGGTRASDEVKFREAQRPTPARRIPPAADVFNRRYFPERFEPAGPPKP